jgi:hypothetical protein
MAAVQAMGNPAGHLATTSYKNLQVIKIERHEFIRFRPSASLL